MAAAPLCVASALKGSTVVHHQQLSGSTRLRVASSSGVPRVSCPAMRPVRAAGGIENKSESSGPVAAAAGGIVCVALGAIMGFSAPVAVTPPQALAATTTSTPPTFVRLPPLSNDPMRCERAFVGNTIGQANGVANTLLDLRKCDYSNNKDDLKGKTLSSALMSDAKFDNADMTEVVMSKAYAGNASFRGVDFSNAVLDRVIFDGADLTGAKFINTVLSGSTFDGSDLADVEFEDALIGYVDVQKICRNKTLSEEAKLVLGCR